MSDAVVPLNEDRGWEFGSSRLHARLIDAGDHALYRALYTDPLVMRHIGGTLTADAVDDLFGHVLRWNGGTPPRARYLRLADAVSGTAIGIHSILFDRTDPGIVELGMMLLPAWQGRGFGTDARSAVIDALFRGGLPVKAHTVRTRHAPDNSGSRAISLALCFEPGGTTASGLVAWRMTRERWFARASSAVSGRAGSAK